VVGRSLEPDDPRDPALRIALAAERQRLDRHRQPLAGMPVGHGALGVGVDQDHGGAIGRQGAGQIDRDRALAGTAFEIAYRYQIAHGTARLPGCWGDRSIPEPVVGSDAEKAAQDPGGSTLTAAMQEASG
jgi:hypothetical protein